MSTEPTTAYGDLIAELLQEQEKYTGYALIHLDAATAEADQDDGVTTEQERDRHAAVGAAYAQLATAKAQAAQAIAAHRANQIAGR